MHTTNLRKVGGSVMLAVPRALLEILHLQPGAKVGIAVESGRLLVEPQQRPRGGRVSLMKRGEIWVVSLDPTSGHEQRGRRPVLILSPEAFNRITKVPVVLPITSGGHFARTAGFAVSLAGTGIKTTGVVRCDQPRALDLGARHGQRLETIPQEIMEEVLARLAPIFD